jgi:hypothetical protein
LKEINICLGLKKILLFGEELDEELEEEFDEE